MIDISSYEAKTHLADLLKKVSCGEHIRITKHKTPVAYLIPISSYKKTSQETYLALNQFRKNKTLGKNSLKEMIEEGRK